MKALVLAILNSLPALRKIPHLAPRARVDSTLFTILNLTNPFSPAYAKGLSRSVVSPDYETERNPPLLLGKSSG